jgi:hypothetical protein
MELLTAKRVLPSTLASSTGAKELVWRNCDSGEWASLQSTVTEDESSAVWRRLCAMDSKANDDGDFERAGLEWQESLPVVKRLRQQLRRLQQREKEARREGGAPARDDAQPAVSMRESAPIEDAIASAPETAAPAPVRLLGPEERPMELWGPGGLCGSAAPGGRTQLFVNLTVRRVPGPARPVPALSDTAAARRRGWSCSAACRAATPESSASVASGARTSSAASTRRWCALGPAGSAARRASPTPAAPSTRALQPCATLWPHPPPAPRCVTSTALSSSTSRAARTASCSTRARRVTTACRAPSGRHAQPRTLTPARQPEPCVASELKGNSPGKESQAWPPPWQGLEFVRYVLSSRWLGLRPAAGAARKGLLVSKGRRPRLRTTPPNERPTPPPPTPGAPPELRGGLRWPQEPA